MPRGFLTEAEAITAATQEGILKGAVTVPIPNKNPRGSDTIASVVIELVDVADGKATTRIERAYPSERGHKKLDITIAPKDVGELRGLVAFAISPSTKISPDPVESVDMAHLYLFPYQAGQEIPFRVGFSEGRPPIMSLVVFQHGSKRWGLRDLGSMGAVVKRSVVANRALAFGTEPLGWLRVKADPATPEAIKNLLTPGLLPSLWGLPPTPANRLRSRRT